MTDIAERLESNTFLAASHPHFAGVAKDCSEGAKEIRRLRAENAALLKFQESMRCPRCDTLFLELGQAKADLAGAQARLAEAERLLFLSHDEIDYHYGAELRAEICAFLGASLNEWGQITRTTDNVGDSRDGG